MLKVVYGLLFWICCIYIAFYDAKHKQIPKRCLCMLVLAGITYQLICCITTEQSVYECFKVVLSASVITGILGMVCKLTKEQIGLGDVKLMGAITLCQGITYAVFSLWIAFLLSGLCSFAGIVLKKVKKQDSLPFAPFVITGMVIAKLL